MFISEAGLLLPVHLWVQGEGRKKKSQPGTSPAWNLSMPMLPPSPTQTPWPNASPRSLCLHCRKRKIKKEKKKYKEGVGRRGGALDLPPPLLTKRQNKTQTRNHQGGQAREGKIPSVSRSLARLLFLLGVQPSPEARWKGRGGSLFKQKWGGNSK